MLTLATSVRAHERSSSPVADLVRSAPSLGPQGELIPALREYHSSLTYLHGLNKDAMGFGGGGDEDHKKAMADVDAEISLICLLLSPFITPCQASHS